MALIDPSNSFSSDCTCWFGWVWQIDWPCNVLVRHRTTCLGLVVHHDMVDRFLQGNDVFYVSVFKVFFIRNVLTEGTNWTWIVIFITWFNVNHLYELSQLLKMYPNTCSPFFKKPPTGHFQSLLSNELSSWNKLLNGVIYLYNLQ